MFDTCTVVWNETADTAFVLDDSLADWEDIFSQVINQHAPIMYKRVRKVKQPQWLTRDILDQLSKRDTLLKKARAYNTADAWAMYRGGARNQATKMISRAKRNYFKILLQKPNASTRISQSYRGRDNLNSGRHCGLF